MNYWVISPNVNAGPNEEAWKEAFLTTHRAFIGWGTDAQHGLTFAKNIEIGDIILVAKGPNSNKRLLICGLVVSDAQGEHLADTPTWAQNRRLANVVATQDLQAAGLDFTDCAYLRAGRIPALYALYPQANQNDKRVCDQLYQLILAKSKEQMRENIANLLKAKHQIILQGPPGTGKTRLSKQLAADLTANGRGESKLIQFHPAYAYEDFVRGIVAEVKDGAVAYTVQNKVLAEFAAQAEAHSDQTFVLIIDEINRANLAAVLGELIYALEYRFDKNKSESEREADVESPYGITPTAGGQPNRTLRLPTNLLIIGTMNTADRSAASLDYAIRRRFAFVEVEPSESAIESEAGKVLFRKVAALFDGPNSCLSPEFRKEDVQPGHSYFMEVANGLSLADRLRYEIKPLLREYLRDGILLPGFDKATEKAINALSA